MGTGITTGNNKRRGANENAPRSVLFIVFNDEFFEEREPKGAAICGDYFAALVMTGLAA